MKTGWIFLLDLLLDGVMVTLALRLGGLKASVWKIGLAALAGAAAARLCAGLPKGMLAALWLPVAAGMMRIAAGRAEKPLRAAGLLLAAAGLLGGTVQALSGAAGAGFGPVVPHRDHYRPPESVVEVLGRGLAQALVLVIFQQRFRGAQKILRRINHGSLSFR